MPNYACHMWLYTKSSDPAVIAEFDQRFDRALELRWRCVEVAANDLADLATQLNQVLNTELLGVIQDLDRADATSCEAFTQTNPNKPIWTEGSNGQHEGDGAVDIKPTAGNPPTWHVTVNGNPHELRAGVRFHEAETPPA